MSASNLAEAVAAARAQMSNEDRHERARQAVAALLAADPLPSAPRRSPARKHAKTPNRPSAEGLLTSGAAGNAAPREVPLEDGAPLTIEQIPSYRKFPVECLPKPIATYVSAIAQQQTRDTAAVALPVLAVLAAAIGKSRRIQARPDWTEPAILWAALIGGDT